MQGLWEADAGTRTPDPFITSEVLYQLSYVGLGRGQCTRATAVPTATASPVRVGISPL